MVSEKRKIWLAKNHERLVQYLRDYRQTSAGKAAAKRYNDSKKGRARDKRFAQTEKGKIMNRRAHKKYSLTEKGKLAFERSHIRYIESGKCKITTQKYDNATFTNIRQEIFRLLGDKCVECDITDHMVLEVDHINNDGKFARERFGTNKVEWLYYLRHREELSNNLQLLCANHHRLKTRLNHRRRYNII